MSATTRAFLTTAAPARREPSQIAFPSIVGRVALGLVIAALFVASVVGGVTAARTALGPTLENGLIHLLQPNVNGLIR